MRRRSAGAVRPRRYKRRPGVLRRASLDYFVAFALVCLPSARRSFFLRRAARFFTLSLPLLFPIRTHLELSSPLTQAVLDPANRSSTSIANQLPGCDPRSSLSMSLERFHEAQASRFSGFASAL